MSDVPRSISLSKNFSSVGHSNHIYDGVFSAPTATKRHASTFSIYIDDYRDIFSPSDASLGSSIPIFDLPPVDTTDVTDPGRTSVVDYAGVFGGVGVNPAEMPSRESKKKAKANSHPSRSSMLTKITDSKSQEIFEDSGNIQALKSPTKTRTAVPRGQEFHGSSSTSDNPAPSHVSQSTRKAGVPVSKCQEFCGSSRDKDNTVSTQESTTPTATRMAQSKSQESCDSSQDNGMSSNVSSDQQSDGLKGLNDPLQKIYQSSKDADAGITQIAHLHAAPGYIGPAEEVNPAGNISSSKANQDNDLSIDVSKEKRQGKQIRSLSDLGQNKQLSDNDAHRAFGMGKSTTFNATHSTRGASCLPQTVSPVSKSPKLFGSSDYFKMSSSQRSKSSTESQQNDAAAGSTSPLLELDVNSTAAASAAAVERAIEEAEAKIRRAKEFLKGCDGSTKLSFKKSLKFKAASNTCHSSDSCGLNQIGTSEVEEEKLLKQKGHFDATVRSENISSNKADGLKLKDDLDFTTSESQLPDEVGILNEKLHGVSAQENMTIRYASLDPVVCVNDAKFVEKEKSPEVVTLTEKSYKDDGVGEWEAAKQISQLISGVKNRFVCFISKQVDTEKIEVQDIPSSSRSVEQFEGSTCHVQDADVHIKRENYQDDFQKNALVDAPSSNGSAEQSEGSTFQVQDNVEKDDEMITYPSSGVEEIVHVSNICMNISKPEDHITVALEVLTGQPCDPSEFELDSEVVESVEIAESLIQEDFQGQCEEILDDCATMENKKDRVYTDGCEEENMAQETAYQSEVHVLEKETICKDNSETQKDVQDQELVEKGVDVSFDFKDGSRRQEEVCSVRETEMADDSEKKLENFQTAVDEFQETEQMAELFTGVSEAAGDTIEHDKQQLEYCTNEIQETVHAAEFLTKSIADVNKVTDGTFEHDEKKPDDVQTVEETCSDKVEEDVEVADLFIPEEDNETVEDAKGKSTVGVTEVTDDKKKLEDAQMVEETCTCKLPGVVQVAELFTWEDNEKTETYELDENKHEDDQIAEETCIHKLEGGVQAAELFTWEDNEKIDAYEHDEEKLEDDQIAEETSTDKLQGGVQVADMFTWEDSEKIVTYEHDEKLEDAQLVEETCTDKLQGGAQVEELFIWEDSEKIDTYEHDKKKLEDDQIAEETCTDKLQGGVAELFTWEDNERMDTYEHDRIAKDTCTDKLQGRVQVAELFTWEDYETINTSEHDEKKLEDDQIAEETFTDKLKGGVQAGELFTWEDNKTIDTSRHDEKNLEDAQIVEETCTDKLQGGVEDSELLQGSVEASEFELFTWEDNNPVEHKDADRKITPIVTEVAEDSSYHNDKKLEDVQIVGETFPDELHEGIQEVDLLTREDSEITEHLDAEMEPGLGDTEVSEETFDHNKFLVLKSRSSQYVQHLGSLNQGEERIEDPTISPAPKMDLEQPVVCNLSEGVCLHDESSQYAQHVRSYPGGKGSKEEIAYSTDDLKMNAENASDCNNNVEPCFHDITSHSGSSSGREERIEVSIACHVEPEMNVVREDICEQDAISKHDDYFPVMSHTCEKEQSSMMTNKESKTEGNIRQPSSVSTIHESIKEDMYEQTGHYTDVANETLAREDECSPLADGKLDHEDECPLSADACRNEVHSFVTEYNEGCKHDEGDEDSQDINFCCEDEKMAESVASISSVPELRNEQPSSVQTVNKLIREDGCETDVDFEQEYTCEEVFPVDNNSETQGDEVEMKTDVGEVDRMHDVETSYKRKRWSENRVQGDEFHQSGILLGDKITPNLDQENKQVGTKVDDERVKESEYGISARQTDACSSAEDVCHITEAYHRRRRWFEDREQEVLSTPVVSDVAQESESVNEGKNSTDAREMDVSSDQVESRATAEAGHRRRRWFERREKLEPVQKPTILEDIGTTLNPEENTAIHVETGETSMESIMKNSHRDELKREKEKKRERKAVQRAIREARERAFVDARERAAVAAQEKQEKVSSEPKSSPNNNKASMDSKLREERAAVERATSEARERAMQKAIFEKSASMSKEKVFKNQAPCSSSNLGYSSATSAAEKSSGVVSESPRRRRAISERHKRTMERAAKALEEKNRRDFLAQKEQDERTTLADALDVDVKRWLTGKDGNLRTMLSSLQYILGPDSGWQPIPLTDLLTSTAVRKAYKRAALCVHPDKLQQRGATIQQKYICEKVFDLLKDAWHKFNPDDW